MGRAEAIEKDRTTIQELKNTYGLALGGTEKDAILAEAANLKLTRYILSPPKLVIPCSAQLKDGGKYDPCVIVPAALPIELLPAHKALAAGGQVQSISRSPFALPSYLMDEAWRAQGFWNGQPLPILVSIGGEYRYLARQKSFFFKVDTYRGSDVDQLSPREPDERDLKLGRYRWASDMSDELALVVAEY